MEHFAAMAATWPPAETRRLGPWTLRRGAGAGSRVSAATLDGPFGGLEAAEAAMRAWGQRPLVMVRPGEAALDAALAGRGYTLADPSLILAADAAALSPAVVPEEAIDCAGPLACMATIWEAGGIGAARRAVMDRAPGPKAWLLGRTGDAPAACAFVAAAAGVAMLHGLEVVAPARRRGLGALLVRAAAAWARDAGATTLALAVAEANAPAIALYRGIGMAEAARYHYRLAPR
jgi:GNAT superfamily N-acetyltransferase